MRAAEEAEVVPVVLSLNVQQFRDHMGAALREADAGALLLVRNGKDGRQYWVGTEVPQSVQAYLDHLPGPEVVDVLARNELATDEPGWVVREDDPDPLEAA